MFPLKKKNSDQNTDVAGRVFDPSDYEKNDQLSSGLATTHEQASDTYTEGEIGAVIDDADGEDIEISKKRKNK
ncbi:YozQ family protein [Niallia circulans]|uniref:YozQ family protein n=1 Tax=Niallia circulans TaxID=1397 RepID=UPI00299DDD01|nr:YozQ family protein [Niallia circulans]